jgi:hypothetical protein
MATNSTPYNNDAEVIERVSVDRRDINFLSPNNFQLVIDNQGFKNLQLLVQKVAIPDMTLGAAMTPGPMRTLGFSGDTLYYSPLEMTFLIDEDLDNYKEVHDWIIAQSAQKDRGSADQKRRDITLIINTSHNNKTKEITFVDAFPTSLSSIPFEADIADVEYMTATVTFEYSYYKFV